MENCAVAAAPCSKDDAWDELVFVDIGDRLRMSPSAQSSSFNKNLSMSSTPTSQTMINNDPTTQYLTNMDTAISKNTTPSSVITGFASPTALSRNDKSGNDLLKALYDRDTKAFVFKQQDSSGADSRMEECIPTNNWKCGSAGLSQAESLSIQRRIKLQSIIRSLDADLSKDS